MSYVLFLSRTHCIQLNSDKISSEECGYLLEYLEKRHNLSLHVQVTSFPEQRRLLPYTVHSGIKRERQYFSGSCLHYKVDLIRDQQNASKDANYSPISLWNCGILYTVKPKLGQFVSLFFLCLVQVLHFHCSVITTQSIDRKNISKQLMTYS